VTDAVNELLNAIEVSPAESPAQLRARADGLMTDFAAAVAAPMRLSMEMAVLRARACAIESRDAARIPVAEAEAALAGAEASHAATAGPEVEAAQLAVAARHEFEQARDGLAEAQRAGAEPAALIEADMTATSAARVDQHQQRVLAEAQAARVTARRAVDTARAQVDRARAGLAAAEAVLASPLTADRPVAERFMALMHTWPIRVALDQAGEMPLDPVDKAIARQLCGELASALGVVPPRLRRQIADEAAREATSAIRRTAITIPGTKVDTTLGALLGNVGG
jgi:hypothetical protein